MVQEMHVPWARENKQTKTPRRQVSSGPGVGVCGGGVPLSSPLFISTENHCHEQLLTEWE